MDKAREERRMEGLHTTVTNSKLIEQHAYRNDELQDSYG
jgi:hypothetical protein